MSGVSDDGSPVEVYRRLPGTGEAELVASVVPPGSTVLELGSGAGRVTNALVERGYAVTAVDDSPQMLEHVRASETVCAKIESLDLERTFDCVLLGSHFVNDPAPAPILETCARHVDDYGVVLVEAYPPGLDWTAGRETRLGDVVVTLVEAEQTGNRVRAAVEYAVDGRTWLQRFEAELLDEQELRTSLSRAGLRFDRRLSAERRWFVAQLS